MSPTKPVPPTPHKEHEIHITPDIYSAVQRLCEKAAPALSEKELEWLACCGDSAELALQNVSDAVEFLGYRMASEEAASDEEIGVIGIPLLLLMLAEFARGINALVFLRGFANNQMRLRNDPDGYGEN